MPEIEIRGISKVFQAKSGSVVALDGVDLSVGDEELVAIVGASGCGKSTLLNLVAGFDEPTRGQVFVGGSIIKGPSPERGVVFQQSALFPWLTVRQNVGFGLRLRMNKSRKQNGPDVDQLLARVGLVDFSDHLPAQLSGGMRQRAAIAGVLAIDPSVLLMDEPFGALDALTRSVMQDFLLELWENNRKTMMLVTHDISEAVYLSDRLIVMSGRPGRIREIVQVDLPRPRRYDVQSSQEFVQIRQHVTRLVRSEID